MAEKFRTALVVVDDQRPASLIGPYRRNARLPSNQCAQVPGEPLGLHCGNVEAYAAGDVVSDFPEDAQFCDFHSSAIRELKETQNENPLRQRGVRGTKPPLWSGPATGCRTTKAEKAKIASVNHNGVASASRAVNAAAAPAASGNSTFRSSVLSVAVLMLLSNPLKAAAIAFAAVEAVSGGPSAAAPSFCPC